MVMDTPKDHLDMVLVLAMEHLDIQVTPTDTNRHLSNAAGRALTALLHDHDVNVFPFSFDVADTVAALGRPVVRAALLARLRERQAVTREDDICCGELFFDSGPDDSVVATIDQWAHAQCSADWFTVDGRRAVVGNESRLIQVNDPRLPEAMTIEWSSGDDDPVDRAVRILHHPGGVFTIQGSPSPCYVTRSDAMAAALRASLRIEWVSP